MTDETMSATTTIGAPPEAVFAVLAQPIHHVDVDRTGWVEAALDQEPLTSTGQIFRMRMYHRNHPDGHYEVDNLVIAFEPPTAISWMPGGVSETTGEHEAGGWMWRYDLAPLGPQGTEVTLTYDWSQVGPEPRQRLPFPPFPPEHLTNSLEHLSELVTG
jgi:uncharacterized protein YndB with AHSA1/START domain